MLTHRMYASLDAQLHNIDLDQIAALYEPPHANAPWEGGKAVAEAVGAYRAQREVLKRQFNVGGHEEVTRALGAKWREAYDEAFQTRAPTLSALVQKIELLADGGATGDEIDAVLRDARRLAAEGQ